MNRDALIARAATYARSYRLAAPAGFTRGPDGAIAGSGNGNSLDFQDFRAYQPGDDPRRVDWLAYARGGQLQLKLFREEISPVVELVPDLTLSMAAYPGKEQSAIFLLAFLAEAARVGGGRPVLLSGARRCAGAEVEAELARLEFDGKDAPVAVGGSSSAGKPLRILLSDFLYPEGAPEMILRAARGVVLLQPLFLLTRGEREPDFSGGFHLYDAEEEMRTLDLRVTAEETRRYCERLQRHEELLAAAAVRNGTRLTGLTAPDEDLTEAGCEALLGQLWRNGVIVAA